MNRELGNWIESKPGPFVARTEGEIWRQAWKNFNDGPTGQIDSELVFSVHLSEARIYVLPTYLGGYVLDKVP